MTPAEGRCDLVIATRFEPGGPHFRTLTWTWSRRERRRTGVRNPGRPSRNAPGPFGRGRLAGGAARRAGAGGPRWLRGHTPRLRAADSGSAALRHRRDALRPHGAAAPHDARRRPVHRRAARPRRPRLRHRRRLRPRGHLLQRACLVDAARDGLRPGSGARRWPARLDRGRAAAGGQRVRDRRGTWRLHRSAAPGAGRRQRRGGRGSGRPRGGRRRRPLRGAVHAALSPSRVRGCA